MTPFLGRAVRGFPNEGIAPKSTQMQRRLTEAQIKSKEKVSRDLNLGVGRLPQTLALQRHHRPSEVAFWH